jgi:hypothetical protein
MGISDRESIQELVTDVQKHISVPENRFIQKSASIGFKLAVIQPTHCAVLSSQLWQYNPWTFNFTAILSATEDILNNNFIFI